MLYPRRSSSSLGFHRNSLESLLNDNTADASVGNSGSNGNNDNRSGPSFRNLTPQPSERNANMSLNSPTYLPLNIDTNAGGHSNASIFPSPMPMYREPLGMDSPLIPMPPAPRAGMSLHYDMLANEWVPGQPMPMPMPHMPALHVPPHPPAPLSNAATRNSAEQDSPTLPPYTHLPHLHNLRPSASSSTLNSNPPRSASRAPRLGYLELVPSPSPSYSTRRWNRFIASPVGGEGDGDDVSVGPSTPGDDWHETNRAVGEFGWILNRTEEVDKLFADTPSRSEADWNAPTLRAPPSAAEYRARETRMSFLIQVVSAMTQVALQLFITHH